MANNNGGHTAPHFDTSNLETFDDFADALEPLVTEDNDRAWKKGDLYVAFCEKFEINPKQGRPKHGEESETFSYLVYQKDLSYRIANAERLTADFYPVNLRTFGLSWRHYNKARETSDDIDNALELLSNAEALHLGYNKFVQYINGEFLVKLVPVDHIHPEERQYLPSTITEVWMTLKAPEREE